MAGHEKSLSSPKKSISGPGAVLFLLTACCSLLTIAAFPACSKKEDGLEQGGKTYGRIGKYERLEGPEDQPAGEPSITPSEEPPPVQAERVLTKEEALELYQRANREGESVRERLDRIHTRDAP